MFFKIIGILTGNDEQRVVTVTRILMRNFIYDFSTVRETNETKMNLRSSQMGNRLINIV